VAWRLRDANARQTLHTVQSWIGMWCIGKYQNSTKRKAWRGWWIARLLNRQNDAGRPVNLMLEVTTKKPQDSPPQDFEEIYLLDLTEKERALEAYKLLTPLLGDVRNKSSMRQALKDVHAACGRPAPVLDLGNSDTESDCDDEKGPVKPLEDAERAHAAPHAEDPAASGEGAKRRKMADGTPDTDTGLPLDVLAHSASGLLKMKMESTTTNLGCAEGEAGRERREGERRERKAVLRLVCVCVCVCVCSGCVCVGVSTHTHTHTHTTHTHSLSTHTHM